uniref:Beta-amylase n=1 Tax=Paeonia suffruticosa TaxID=45171 RepID=A0A126DHM2_PAESU|nr:beta-amylase [Paeonia suffruticosa]
MEVAMIGSSQVNIGRSELAYTELGFLRTNVFSQKTKAAFGQTQKWRTGGTRYTLKAAQSEITASQKVSGDTSISAAPSKSVDSIRLFVGLPLDAVSGCNTVNHARAIAAGLKALKLLGVQGVELPVWWGIAEKKAMGKYEWSSYLALAEMVKKVGLKLHVSLCFHASKEAKVSLPEWVSHIGETQPSIFFKDRSGQHYKDCLSLAVDDMPILNGKSPIQVYQEFCESFKSSFAPFMGSTITGITMGLGPHGELRYPSHHRSTKSNQFHGVGEFQCYDESMLSLLKQHAEANGNPNWGLGGPHDTPRYDESPNMNNFFKDHGGSWETPYGDFFLSWYSSQLLAHGNRILSIASSTFTNPGVMVSGKLPLIHAWYKTRSHPSELTSGFYNTIFRDGYEAIAEIFGRHSCKMILPGMELSDEDESNGCLSSPESLLAQIKSSCIKHGVEVSGQNSTVLGNTGGFEQIKKNLLGGDGVVDLFTYQRMGAEFFSPDHFPSFSRFVLSINGPELHSDDLAIDEKDAAECVRAVSTSNTDSLMQVA